MSSNWNKIPFLPKDRLDAEAEAFLKTYGYDDLLKEAQITPIREIAEEAMGLTIIDNVQLSADESIQGMIVFQDATVYLYDSEKQEYRPQNVKAGTILLDSGLEKNIGRKNHTLAHECYHWYKHHDYFISSSNHKAALRCNDRVFQKPKQNLWTDIEKLEWQAKMLAPRILMPARTAKPKAFALYRTYCEKNKNTKSFTPEQAASYLGSKLAKQFAVSKQTAVLRVKDFGYPHTERSIAHLNHRKSIQMENQDSQQYQKISLEESFELYCNHSKIREMVDAGKICFADGYFVINSFDYINRENFPWKLTDTAWKEKEKCILNICADQTVQTEQGVLYRKDDSWMLHYKSKLQSERVKSIEETAGELAVKYEEIKREFNISRETHSTAVELLQRRLKDVRYREFFDKTLLSKITFNRIKNNPEHLFDLKTIVTIGIGMKIPLPIVEEALQLSGHCFSPVIREHHAYQYLLSTCLGATIDECNAVLERLEIAPLGSRENKSSERD